MPVLNETAQDVIKIRRLLPEDRNNILCLLEKTSQFTSEEKQCALELADIYFKQGESSGYDYFASVGLPSPCAQGLDKNSEFLGYICFGKIPLTDACYDIYWIVVDPEHQGRKIGTQLLDAAEEKLKRMGARKIFVETSSQQYYLPAQNFYEKRDFRLASRIRDFYKIGDDKLVFVKEIQKHG